MIVGELRDEIWAMMRLDRVNAKSELDRYKLKPQVSQFDSMNPTIKQGLLWIFQRDYWRCAVREKNKCEFNCRCPQAASLCLPQSPTHQPPHAKECSWSQLPCLSVRLPHPSVRQRRTPVGHLRSQGHTHTTDTHPVTHMTEHQLPVSLFHGVCLRSSLFILYLSCVKWSLLPQMLNSLQTAVCIGIRSL